MKFLFILILLAGCASRHHVVYAPEGTQPAPEVKPTVVPQPVVTKPTEPAPAKIVVAEIESCLDCTDDEAAKNSGALIKIRQTLAGQCFKDKWLQMPLIQTLGKTNSEILEMLLKADVKLPIQMYFNRWTSSIGYTIPDDPTIYFNRKYHSGYDECDVGSNLAHEISHKLGFDHDFEPTPTRPQSVPYSINTVFEACCTM